MEVDPQRWSIYFLVDRDQKKFGHPWYTLYINIIYRLCDNNHRILDTNVFGGVYNIHNDVIHVYVLKTLCDPVCPCRVVKTKTFVYDCILYEGRVRGCHVARVANGAKTPTPPCCSSATTKKKAFRRAACRRRRTRAPNRQRQPQRAIDNARRRRPVRGGDARTPMRKCTTTENTAPPRRRYSSFYRPLSIPYTHHRIPRPRYYYPKYFLYFLETNTL